MQSSCQEIDLSKLGLSGVELCIKREDLLHPEVSGNKFRKLNYNLKEAKSLGSKTLLTFGGAYSNHIAATAAAGALQGFRTIGVIRGEELGGDLERTLSHNATLRLAHQKGMQFYFVSREVYRNKDTPEFLEGLKVRFGDFYCIPEGGTNALAVRGCEEILTTEDKERFDLVCCPVGTGGTVSGIINSSREDQEIIGFSVLKESYLHKDISCMTNQSNWKLNRDYHFGGYAKVNDELVNFVNNFYNTYQILLDPIYTGKMLYGILDMISRKQFLGKRRILAIHTGGIQGIDGVNSRLKKKNKTLIIT